MSITISSYDATVAAVRAAARTDASAYVLRPGPLRDALAAAARGGAHVAVTLQADPYAGNDAAAEADMAAVNASAADELRAAGATVTLLPRATSPFHLKAALCDGVAFLDDRNWADDGRETIVRDDEADDTGCVRDALALQPANDPHLATRKARALAIEAGLVYGAAAQPLAIESEAFGWGPVDQALLWRAKQGFPTRLLVASSELNESSATRERTTLAALAKLGVEIRTVDTDEKLAVAGERVWVGSANATNDVETADQPDWGMISRLPNVVDGVRAAFERNWAQGTPLRSDAPTA